MSRYFARPRSATVNSPGQDFSWADRPDNGAPQQMGGFEVDDHEAVDTGLIMATGEPIYRAPNPMGFGREGEW